MAGPDEMIEQQDVFDANFRHYTSHTDPQSRVLIQVKFELIFSEMHDSRNDPGCRISVSHGSNVCK